MILRLLTVLVIVMGIALAGTRVTAGASASGHVWAWGDNADGELGNGTITRYGGLASPVEATKLTGATAVAGGSFHSLALRSDGTVWAWGSGGWGQLGQGSYGSSATPIRVPGLSGVTAIAAGDLHSLALKSDGTVWAWGYNIYGQIGNGASGDNVLSPTKVRGLSGVVAISAGPQSDTSYAAKSDGTVWAWGFDGVGDLGNGTSDDSPHSTPVKVSNLTGVVALGGGTFHALALRSDGTVWAWGRNDFSQLGAKTTSFCSSYPSFPCSTVPIKVSGLSGVTAVAGGGEFSLALKSDGTVWGWGNNAYGQLANGNTTPVYGGVKEPTKAHLSSITAIAAGGNHSLALKSDGVVWGAGANYAGQLGNGTFKDSSNPVRVVTLTGVTGIGAGWSHSLAVVPSS
ncbi:MAG: RCC1 domain-containing protein [Chloroflexota bacterium]